MGQNGGARPGAGRKPKIQEIKIIEQMDAVSVPSEIWNYGGGMVTVFP